MHVGEFLVVLGNKNPAKKYSSQHWRLNCFDSADLN